MFEEDVVCKGCGSTMAIRDSHYECPNCRRSITAKQAHKKKNRKKSPATKKLERLHRDGKITLRR